MPKKISQRMHRVQMPMIPIVGEWIAQHPGTISLGQGIVHYAPPEEVQKAVVDATDEQRTNRYGLVRGIDELLHQIAHKVATENFIEIGDQNRIVVTAGSNMGFLNAVLAVADVDDEIILLGPYYFNHEMAIDIAGCRSVIVPTDERHQLNLSAIRDAITDRTRAVVTVSPSNPTGAVYSREALSEVNQLCERHNVYHISDEAYEYFVYGDVDHFSAGGLPNASAHTISLFSLSKAYGMAGWRCGYMIIPNHLETAVKKVQDTNLVCPPMISQFAATAALKTGSEWCAERIAEFQHVRDLVLHELSRLGTRCKVPPPDGAFYALVQLETTKRDIEVVETLIRDFGVAVMPGSTFGADDGCFVRIAYGALDKQSVANGMGRLVKGLEELL